MNTRMPSPSSAFASAEAAAGTLRMDTVRFSVDGERIVGTLYMPRDASHEPLPAVVLTGSLTSVKEQMSGAYARAFAERGFIALAFDHRHYGESEGSPRQFESPARKAEDLAAAVAYLRARSDVRSDRISLVGVCTGGGNVLEAAASDLDVAAVVGIVGWLAEPALASSLYGDEARVQQMIQDSRNSARDGTTEYTMTYGPAGSGAAHEGEFDYYLNPERGSISGWSNRLATRSWEGWLNFDPVASAARVTVPTLLIHSEQAALPEQARKVFTALPGEKQIVWLEGGHFDFYDKPDTMSAAVDAAIGFFRR